MLLLKHTEYSIEYTEARPGVDNLEQTMNEPRIDASGRVHWTVPLDISVIPALSLPMKCGPKSGAQRRSEIR